MMDIYLKKGRGKFCKNCWEVYGIVAGRMEIRDNNIESVLLGRLRGFELD